MTVNEWYAAACWLIIKSCDEKRGTKCPYVVAVFQSRFQSRARIGLLECHEKGVDDDTQSDEEIDEGIHDEQFDDVSELVPVRMAVPSEHQLETLLLQKLLLVHAFLVAEQSCTLTVTSIKAHLGGGEEEGGGE